MNAYAIITLSIGAIIIPYTTAAVAGDEITALPGWDAALPSKQYSGYLDIPTAHGTGRMHYWYVAYEGADNKDVPVILWLNGGPGCSSLDGLVYEHGPFRINATDPSKLYRFDQTWARVGHMLYLESPLGVGYSYSNDKADYNVDDNATAAQNLAAVEKFFALYPELGARDFFITGESYAGVYVPTLAEAILDATEAGTYTGAPLKGMAAGNGCTGTEIGTCGGQRNLYDTLYLLGTAFIPDSLKHDIRATCDLTAFDPTVNNTKCASLIQQMHATVGHINLYNVYGECISAATDGRTHKAPFERQVGGPDACIDSSLGTAYLSQASVIAASHVVKQPFTWCTCCNQIRYTSTRPNLPRYTYPKLVRNMHVLIYNGDWDACVPFTDNQAWTTGMGFAAKSPWAPWIYDPKTPMDTSAGTQVGGYATVYDVPGTDAATASFSFITVRGGRHEVPETAPFKALAMITRFTSLKGFGRAARDEL